LKYPKFFIKLESFGRRILLFAGKGPVYHYTYGRWRFGKWLQKIKARSFYPDNALLLAELGTRNSALIGIESSISDGDFDSAIENLTTYFLTRTNPTFYFGLGDKKKLIELLPKDQMEETVRLADEICENIFNFRRVDPVKFKDYIDWRYLYNVNKDWTWDLNRHVYFETLGRAYWYTGDERYTHKFRELLLDWVEKNPACVNQPNWSSAFEVAFRINTWIWAFYYFRCSTVFDNEACLVFLKGLLAHGRYLDTNLELHVQNNHLLLEAKALAMLGLLFPEFKRSEKWLQRGLRILYDQIRKQVCSDGVHGERASHYHRVITGEILELLILLENNEIPIPLEILDTFGRMVEFELWLTKPNGLIPLLGDSALEDTHLRFSGIRGGPVFLKQDNLKSVAPPPDEGSIWLLGYKRIKQRLDSPQETRCLNSRHFPEGGYFIMRNGYGAEAGYLVVDCGPFGYKPTPSHGHADALSFELHAFGQTMIVDPGVYSTHMGKEWRNFFRGSCAHNTVVVDDQDQSILLDTQRVYCQAQCHLHQWFSNDNFDFFDGSHNGYERFSQPITHRRQIFFVKPNYWVVVDSLIGRGEHCFDLYFHLMPGMDTQLDPKSDYFYASNSTGQGLIIAPLNSSNLKTDIIIGETRPIQGWVSLFSGEKQLAPTLRYRQERAAPAQFCTVLYSFSTKREQSIKLHPLEIKLNGQIAAEESNLIGLQIETDTYIDRILIDQGPAEKLKYFCGVETDGQLIFLRQKKEDNYFIKAIMRGGDKILIQGMPLQEFKRVTTDCILDFKK